MLYVFWFMIGGGVGFFFGVILAVAEDGDMCEECQPRESSARHNG